MIHAGTRAHPTALAEGDDAILIETGERVRIVAVLNASGDLLVEDAAHAVVTVPAEGLEPTWWRRAAGCGCCAPRG